MSGLRICLLGAPLIEKDGRAVSLDRRKAVALLAYLAVTEQTEARDALAALLWPDLDRSGGLAALRRTLRSLTKNLGPEYFCAKRSSIRLLSDKASVDVVQFRRLAAERPAEDAPLEAWKSALPDLEKAVELYRDNFLTGFTLRDAEEFEEWQFLQTERLRGELNQALDGLVLGCRLLGDFDRALQWAQRRLSRDLLAEDVHRSLMELYAAAGRRSEALRQYEKCVEVLRQQLQVAPEAETVQLYEKIKGGDVGREPGPETAQPAPAPFFFNLPKPPTPLVGRTGELEQLGKRMQDPDCRLLTLIGPGGIGKTRLVLEAARVFGSSFPDGVCFIPLANSSADRVVSVITEALGLSLDPQGDAETQLLTRLSGRRLLIVLDNFEHVLERAGLVSDILLKSQPVKVIVTSRARLNLRSEQILEIKGLDVPQDEISDGVEAFSAVELFLQAARRADPSFSLSEENRPHVIRICKLLDGLPLAIELAAAWLRLMPCPDIVREIEKTLDFLSFDFRDFPERHRSLRAVFDSSVSLLSQEEQDALCGLSVFKGGFTREGAQKVAGAPLTTLASLIDKSLLSRIGSNRCHMHELIRQFAVGMLEGRPQLRDQVHDLHCEFYLDFMAARVGGLKSEGQRTAMEEIQLEIDNIRPAWRWAVERRLSDLLEKSLEAIEIFYTLANWLTEGEEILRAAARAVSKEERPLLWAKIVARQARFDLRLWRYQKATRLLEQSLAIFRHKNDSREIALTLAPLSIVFFQLGAFEKASKLAEEGTNLWRRLDDPHGLADSLIHMGRVLATDGDEEKASQALDESYSIFKQLGDQNGMSRCLINLGVLSYIRRDYQQAIDQFNSGLEIVERMSDRRGAAFCLANMGLVYEDMGHHERAKEMSKEALRLFNEIGYQKGNPRARRGPAGALENLGRATFGLKQYEESKQYFVAALRTAMEIKATPQMLLCLVGLSRLFAHWGDHAKAWELICFAANHPSAGNEVRQLTRNVRAEIKPQMTPEQVRKAERRAKRAKLEDLANDILDRLETDQREIPNPV